MERPEVREDDSPEEPAESLKNSPTSEVSVPDVAEAKQRFLRAANDFSPLGIVRRRPFASVGVAFLAGLGLSALGASRTIAPTLSAASQISGLAAQFAPLLIKRARSSDG